MDETAEEIRQATPFLGACFAHDAADQEIMVRITLGGGEDPDIDHTRAFSRNGGSIDHELEDCVRKSIEPMRRQTNDKIELTYMFRVADSKLEVRLDVEQIRGRLMTPRIVEDGRRRGRSVRLTARRRSARDA